jgi:DnaD/phage-associated family protein
VKYGTSPNEVEQDSLNKTTEEQDPLNKTTSRSSSSLTWDTLKDQYGATQVEAAIEAAPPNKRRSLKYVAGILRNWQQEGAPQEAETSGRRYVPEEYADLIEH